MTFSLRASPNSQVTESCSLTGLSGQRAEFEANRVGRKLKTKFQKEERLREPRTKIYI